MKVIDLLNKIANGEEAPKKIKFDKYIFELDKLNTNYISEWGRNLTFHLGQCQKYALTEEIEIIEEEQDIKEIIICKQDDEYLVNKINEIIKEVNKQKNNEKVL